MVEDYWLAEILSAERHNDELLLRVAWSEADTTIKPVTELHLKGSSLTNDGLALIKGNLYVVADIYFHTDETTKWLEINFDVSQSPEIRIEYAVCEQQKTAYNVDELIVKLNQLNDEAKAERQKTKKLRGVIDQLQIEILKEIDRLAQKAEFFAGTEKTTRYTERLRCYQKVNYWITRFDRDE